MQNFLSFYVKLASSLQSVNIDGLSTPAENNDGLSGK